MIARRFRGLPLNYLLDSTTSRDFRRRAGEVLKELSKRQNARIRAERECGNATGAKRRAEDLQSLRELLRWPNLEEFLTQWNRLSEVLQRASIADKVAYTNAIQFAEGHLDDATLTKAAFALQQAG